MIIPYYLSLSAFCVGLCNTYMGWLVLPRAIPVRIKAVLGNNWTYMIPMAGLD
jgi:hypothetical protein